MTTPPDPLALGAWRREIAEIYAAVRRDAPHRPERAWEDFRAKRDALFRNHAQSPIAVARRKVFSGVPYFPYQSDWRCIGHVEALADREHIVVDLPTDGEVAYTRFARVRFEVGTERAALSLFWIEGYGGGLFLPFRDATSGVSTYGGGRYLYDTIKGADLGAGPSEVVLDFNFAYHPSCAYDPRWTCPLAPPENTLPFRVDAGERLATEA